MIIMLITYNNPPDNLAFKYFISPSNYSPVSLFHQRIK